MVPSAIFVAKVEHRRSRRHCVGRLVVAIGRIAKVRVAFVALVALFLSILTLL
jgi:hypothetical protein